jgi:16S rRNA (guanine(966)-N(2))-methyltransferase RsmD
LSRIRITGGAWRSRHVNVAAIPGLRPTPDRVRETLFNWLGQDLTGLSCLDLFAGSGILGFEAASRGAVVATLVERDQRAIAALRHNADALGGERLEIVRADALEFLSHAPRRYDVVFLDPPYGCGWLTRIEESLPRALDGRTLIYAEAEHDLERIGNWLTFKRGRAGQVHYHLLRAG